MYGTAPSHTSSPFSMHAIARYAPPLPPNTYPYGRCSPYFSAASTREYVATAALAR